jgi:putative FmdB family regulatory protein
MPLYEYLCHDCRTRFDALRSMKDADAPIACRECQGENTSRVISLFFAHSDGRSIAHAVRLACRRSSQSHACSTCGA